MVMTLPLKGLAILFLTVMLCSLGNSLHITQHMASDAEEAQLEYLIGLQKNYKTQIINLSERIRLVSEELDEAGDLDEQIKILEAAISDEREQIGSLSTKITPNPNAAEMECQILSKEDREALTAKA